MVRAVLGVMVCLLLAACDAGPAGQEISQADAQARLSGRTLALIGPRGGALGQLRLNADGTGVATIASGGKRTLRWQVIDSSLCLMFTGQTLNQARDCAEMVWTSPTALRVQLPGARDTLTLRIIK